jgi:hypothetical protein
MMMNLLHVSIAQTLVVVVVIIKIMATVLAVGVVATHMAPTVVLGAPVFLIGAVTLPLVAATLARTTIAACMTRMSNATHASGLDTPPPLAMSSPKPFFLPNT